MDVAERNLGIVGAAATRRPKLSGIKAKPQQIHKNTEINDMCSAPQITNRPSTPSQEGS